MAAVVSASSVSKDPSLDLLPRTKSPSFSIFGFKKNLGKLEQAHLVFLSSYKSNQAFTLRASREPPGLTQELSSKKLEDVEVQNELDPFIQLKERFLSFKRHKYLENLEHYQSLAKAQAPKVASLSILLAFSPMEQFLVIACADSRVCPSSILGFQPGEAFMVRNVANLVPPYENGPTETNAALEFAVNSLEVENIFVIGHSCCGGIRALMSMQDEADLSFIQSWVIVGRNARLSTKASASSLSFDQQCRHCEKESINRSLVNLLSYPWIEERVKKGALSIHGGYYDFVDCAFEKWTLDYKNSLKEEIGKFSFKNRAFWS
ncbi:Carbonic anhydrase [Dillenia turbinata]|uniref:Carbonic anhydrase n=1 Tax=Dillenia turbinata TaxID=194707 RepID=A0AAN8W495_9MAGN